MTDQEQILQTEVRSIEGRMQTLEIKNDVDYRQACEYLQVIKNGINKVQDYFRELIESAHRTHKALCGKRNEFLKPLQETEKEMKLRIGHYAIEKEKGSKHAESNAQAEAEKQEAEKKEELEYKAQQSEQTGNLEEARMYRRMKEEVYVAPWIVPALKQPDGVSVQCKYEVEIIDKSKLPLEYMKPDMTLLNRVVRAAKGAIDIPGILIKKIPQVTMRGTNGNDTTEA